MSTTSINFEAQMQSPETKS